MDRQLMNEATKNGAARLFDWALNYRRALWRVTLLLLAMEGFLLLSGYRILIGEEYYPEHDAVRYIPASEATFGCTYFSGRKSLYETLSSYQYKECPFVWTGD